MDGPLGKNSQSQKQMFAIYHLIVSWLEVILKRFLSTDSLQEQISPNVLPSELSGQGRSLKDEEGIDFSTVSDYFKDLKKYIFND